MIYRRWRTVVRKDLQIVAPMLSSLAHDLRPDPTVWTVLLERFLAYRVNLKWRGVCGSVIRNTVFSE